MFPVSTLSRNETTQDLQWGKNWLQSWAAIFMLGFIFIVIVIISSRLNNLGWIYFSLGLSSSQRVFHSTDNLQKFKNEIYAVKYTLFTCGVCTLPCTRWRLTRGQIWFWVNSSAFLTTYSSGGHQDYSLDKHRKCILNIFTQILLSVIPSPCTLMEPWTPLQATKKIYC